MASFLTSLWESIFTPGPTPVLLVATNASFGALQLLLLILLAATKSIHFVVLSVLCGGLWYAINWFAKEVQAAKDKEEAEKEEKAGDSGKGRKRMAGSPDPGSDTETETEPRAEGASTGVAAAERAQERQTERRKVVPRVISDDPTASSSQDASDEPGTSSGLLHPSEPGSAGKGMGDSDLLRRRRSVGDSSGYVSTDSEWEKVDEEEGTK